MPLAQPSLRRPAWGSIVAMMVPSSGPQKFQICRGKADGVWGPRPLGSGMDSSASAYTAPSTATTGAWLRPTTWRLPRSPTECEPGGVHGTASWNSVMAPIADPTKGRFAGKNCKGSTILTLGGSDPLVWLSYERLERMEREAGQDRARGPRSSNRARLLTGSRNRNQTGRSATNGEPCTGRTALGR
jgi:hypothetical protein